MARLGQARRGRPGMGRRGLALPGAAWRGCQGGAWRDYARQGEAVVAGRGSVRPGKARQAWRGVDR